MFTGCESDESFENSENIEEITLLPDHHDNLYSTRAIDIKDNPKLLMFLEKDVGRQQRNNNGGSAIITDFGEVPLDNIQQVIDTIGNVNYTFAFRTNKQYENRFFNLVISQSSEDQSPTPYIVEYAMTPDFKERYNIEEVNMESFTGFIRTYLLADFDDNVRNMNDCSELPIVVPISSSGSCGEEEMEDGSSDTNEGHGDPVDDGDTSGGGGTSGDGSGVGTGPSGNSSGSVTCNTSISTQSCSGCGCHFGTSTECTAGFKGSTTLTTSCSDGTVNVTEITIKNMRSSGCGPSGNMAIIPVPYKSLERVLNLTDSEADCLNENCDLKNQINQFVNQNEVTLNDPELAFANSVIDQLSDSCGMDFEVDFDDKIYLANSFSHNCKTARVYDQLKELSDTFFSNLISNNFGSDKNANIRFEIDPSISELTSNAITLSTFNGGDRFFKIKLNPNYVQNASLLEIAETLMHETVHAELLERCIQSGLIESLFISPSGLQSVRFINDPITYNTPAIIFNQLVLRYRAADGGNTDWQHYLFNIFDYRDKISDDLGVIHTLIDDPGNQFENIIYNTPQINNLNDCFNALSWRGLENTADYQELSSSEQSIVLFTQDIVRANYNQNCN